MKTEIRIIILVIVSTVMAFGQANPSNIYAVGISANPSATPAIAGTGLYARLIADTGTYAFSAIDVLPVTVKPFVVTTQISGGVAQKLVQIGRVPIYWPTSAGISYNGTNTGWAWTTGALASIKLKDNWRIMPNVRMVKSSVSGGTGYQVITGVLIGYSQ